jgi:hypothetical protein
MSHVEFYWFYGYLCTKTALKHVQGHYQRELMNRLGGVGRSRILTEELGGCVEKNAFGSMFEGMVGRAIGN